MRQHFAALKRRGYSVRAYLTALVAIALVPAMLFGGWLASQSGRSESTLLMRQAERESREIANMVEREIGNAHNILTALVGSYALTVDNIELFGRQAAAVAKQLDIAINLRDPAASETIVSTASGSEKSRAERPPEWRDVDARALKSGNPVVSNVFWSLTLKRLVAAVTLPVMFDGEPKYLLSIVIPAERFYRILHDMRIPPQWTVTIFDRNAVIVARSDRNSEYAGTTIRAVDAAITQQGEDLVIARAAGRDGVAHTWFRRNSDSTGWSISVGVPQSVLDAPIHQAFLNFGIAGSFILLAALGLAYHLGGRVSHSIGALGIDRAPTREEFQVLFEYAPNGVVVVDSGGQIALVNEQMERMFGHRREDLIGQPIESLIPERFLGSYAKTPGSSRMRPGSLRDELYGRRKDGSEFPIEIGLNPIGTPGGNMVIATMIDITARKEAAERLARTTAERDDLRRRLMQAQEDERLRLAHELHDQTGQSLTAVMLQLKGVESLVTEQGRERLRMLRKQLEEMGKTLHRVAWELRPAAIDELGLASALANYVADWSAQTGVDADFHCRDPRVDQLPEEVRTALYRVVQEALTNIAKHAAGPTAVSVIIDRSEGILRLTIEDDGHGFDPAAPGDADRRGLGLAGMRERLALIGGELELETSVGVGTTIFARVPLEQERLIA